MAAGTNSRKEVTERKCQSIGGGAEMGEGGGHAFWPSLVGVQDRDTLIEQSPVTYSNRTVIYCDIAVKSFLYSYSFIGGVLLALIPVEGPEEWL